MFASILSKHFLSVYIEKDLNEKISLANRWKISLLLTVRNNNMLGRYI